MKELQYLNKYFFKYKYRFLFGILITISAQIFALYAPQYIGNSINAIEQFIKNNSDKATLIELLKENIYIIIGATIIYAFLTFLMRQTIIVMSRHIEFDLKNEVYAHYQYLCQSFYKQNRIGDLMNRISDDVGKVRSYVGPAVMYTSNILIRFTVVVIYMYNISPKLTLYSLLPLPFLSIGIFKISSEIHKRSRVFQENISTLSSFTQEIFSGIRVIKAYAIENKKANEFEVLSQNSKQKSLDLNLINSLFGPLMVLLIGLSNLVVIYVGGQLYIKGEIPNIGLIAQFILYINMLTWPVASLGWVSSMVQEAEASQKRINEFLLTEPHITNNGLQKEFSLGAIELKNVSFTYPDTGINALKNVNLTLPKNKTVAVFGKTGSGKSTLLSLISRLYDVENGAITINQENIKDIDLFKLRNNVAVVPQDAFLFSDSIKNNIKFGNNDATDEEVTEVAKKAAVHNNIIDFTNGYDTVLGERGITLSGGQKQRVSIARALIKDAPILLLDDCLSAVDTETEEQILNALLDYCKNKTTLIVSHRVSTAKNADTIVILDEGEIIEQGTHNELIAQNGYYKELYVKQLSEKENV